MPEVRLKGPLPHQEPCYVSEKERKILRWGRRVGKTRIAFLKAIVGHGPTGDWSATIGEGAFARTVSWAGRKLRGVIAGFDVFWISRDYKQAGVIWREEVKPRFQGQAPHIKIVESDKRVDFMDGTRVIGSFIVRSAENINSVRGSGDRLAGVIIDEAAYLDLQEAVDEVVEPALLDNEGWLVLMSTTNAGPDGYEELDTGKRTPSYFNILCERFENGLLGDEWGHWHLTTYDNPLLTRRSVDKLVSRYPSIDDPKCQQEIFASLLVSFAGVAFPEWRDHVHTMRLLPERMPAIPFRWAAGGDWGYEAPGYLHLFASTDTFSYCRFEYQFQRMRPYDVGYAFTKAIQRFPRPEWIAIDTPAVSDGGPDILEKLQQGANAASRHAPTFINPPKGPGSRETKKTLLHDYLAWEMNEDGEVTEHGKPKLMFHPDCEGVVRTLPRLPRDPKKVEDVDTDADDHAYDSVTAWLMARTPYVERQKTKSPRHPDDREPLNDRYAEVAARDETTDPFREIRRFQRGPSEEDELW